MNVLILGSGGREHAFAWKLKQSKLCSALYIAPGNAGTMQMGENLSVSVLDFMGIKKICIDKKIQLVIVGPEDPLVAGIYDFFMSDEQLRNILVVGPSKNAAQLEGSKAFSKHFMERHKIPTATYKEFTLLTFDEGIEYIDKHTMPVVLKADGLAAGKGVVICTSRDEAKFVFTSMIKDKQFGDASSRVVVEQFLNGIEISVFVVTDGKDYKIIGHAKDYKRIGEGDTGLNTGGMGCVSPVPFADEEFMQKVKQRIIEPTVNGIYNEKFDYKGFIFFGLINVGNEPYVIEYNCRMGDPETEVVLPLLKNDFVTLCTSLYNGTLSQQNIEIDSRCCATVVAVSGGYPGNYTKCIPINGLLENVPMQDSIVFHSGTTVLQNEIVTNGGRVLAVTSLGDTLQHAVNKSMHSLSSISFDGMYFRKDIGYEFE